MKQLQGRWSLELAIFQVLFACLLALPQSPVMLQALTLTLGIFGLGSFCRFFLRTHGYTRPADYCTLLRLILLALLTIWFLTDPETSWQKVTLVGIAFALDGLDGFVARKTRPSESGALFDMETDSWFVYTLCILSYCFLAAPAIVFVPALLRPAFVLGTLVLNKLRVPLQPGRGGNIAARIIFVIMAFCLLFVFSPAGSKGQKELVLIAGTGLLCFSFLRETLLMFKKSQ